MVITVKGYYGMWREAVRITYDPQYDVLYLKFAEVERVLCKEVAK